MSTGESSPAAADPSALRSGEASLKPSTGGDESASASAAPISPAPVDVSTAPVAPEPVFVYALGQLDPRFPSVAIEKEFAQAVGSPESAGLTDRQSLKRAISERQNRYLARGLCWVFVIEGLDTYIVVPRDPGDIDLLIDAYREESHWDDLDLVIGVRTHIAPPEMCNGLALPVVVFDHLYSFDREALIESIPAPDSVSAKSRDKFRAAAGGLFDDLMQMADNAGAIDEHRAVNYLAVRYPRIYGAMYERFEGNYSFAGVDVADSRLSGVRSIVDVIFSYRHRETDVVEKLFARVDVTEEFPFLVTKLSPYYDR